MAGRPTHRAALVTGSYEQDGKRKDRTITGGAAWDRRESGGPINVELEAMPPCIDGKYRITLWPDDGDRPDF